MAEQLKRYSLGEWELEIEKRLLRREDQTVRLANKPFQVLLYLIENRARLVSRKELLEHFWQGSDVYDATLTQCVGAVRRALDDRLDSPRFIETRWAAGYRYVGPLKEQLVEDATSVVEVERTRVVKVVVEEEEFRDEESSSESGISVRVPASSLSSARPKFSPRTLVAVLVCAVFALTALGALVYRGHATPASGSSLLEHSLAVLPLKNLTGDPANEYLSDGMTESLISYLSKIQGLRVISRSSVFALKGKEVDPQEIGKRLRVATMLEGSLRKAGDRIQVDVRLVSADDGRVLWSSDIFDRPISEIFAIQEEIARRAAVGLGHKLDPAVEQRLVKRGTSNAEAYRAYLLGRYFWNQRTPVGLRRASEYFQQAIKADPRYALAYAGLSDYYGASIWFMTQPPRETIAKMREAAQKAVEFDDALPAAHIALSRVYTYDSDLANGNREIERAIELDPESAEAHHGYAYGLIMAGRADEAVIESKRALELDPLSVPINVDVGEILLYARRYDEAIEALRKSLEMDPHRPNVHHDLAEAYLQKGMEREAIAEFIEEDSSVGESQETLAALKEAYGVSGVRGFWQKKLDSFKERSKHGYFPPFVIAEIYARLNEKDQAFAWLEKAFAEHSPLVLNLKHSAALDGLRLDPRFAQLTHRVFSD